MCRSIGWAAVLALAGTLARAEQYWIAYEGNDFPENEGWTRITHAGGAQRYFEDGALVLDGLASTQITDFYRMYRPGALDPGAGEVFVAEWRVCVDEVSSLADPIVEVLSDEGQAVVLELEEARVTSFFEPGLSASFAPYLYHEFELRSTEMQSYQLLIDGHFAMEGLFHDAVLASRFSWGDGVQGAASLSHWDYVRFGAVAEPGALALLVICASAVVCRAHEGRRAA